MGRPSNAAERRHQIIEATIRVMAHAGFAAASVQAIAQEADLSAGLLHHHFSNKDEILLQLPEHLEAVVERRCATLSARKRTAWGRLMAWVDAHLAMGDDARPDAAAAWVWLGAHALGHERLAQRHEAVLRRRLERLGELLSDVARERRVRIDVPGLAIGVLAAIEGYYQLAAGTRLVPPGSAAPSLRAWLRLGLHGSPR